MPINWGRLRSITAHELINALTRDGFILQRQRGSHRLYRHPDRRRVTISFHQPGGTFDLATLRSIIQVQDRWTQEALERLGLL